MPIRRSRTGAWLVTATLENLGIKTVLGIPGVHNNELYLELSQSKTVSTLLVNHELHGAYMADAISRTSDDQIGTLLTVPGAGITHAASGIGEAFLAGIPMLIIATGVRSDLPYAYQLHDIDQQQLLNPITKQFIRVNQHQEIPTAISEAYQNCQTDEPGPIAVEIPANILLMSGLITLSNRLFLSNKRRSASALLLHGLAHRFKSQPPQPKALPSPVPTGSSETITSAAITPATTHSATIPSAIHPSPTVSSMTNDDLDINNPPIDQADISDAINSSKATSSSSLHGHAPSSSALNKSGIRRDEKTDSDAVSSHNNAKNAKVHHESSTPITTTKSSNEWLTNPPPPLSPQRDFTINLAIDMLLDAKRPGIFVGWGARKATAQIIELAERLYAPVATTLQGLSAFPHNHPLHTGMGFGPAATLPSLRAFNKCDCLLAVGTRFSELGTASYSLPVPKKLIHIDINPTIFNRNFPATFTLAGDAATILPRFVELLRQLNPEAIFRREHSLTQQIAKDKALHKRSWLNQINRPDRVNPAFFFSILDDITPNETIIATDDGHHTFLTAELKPIYHSGHFISPTDFNSMGYCVPAVIGAKMANPKQLVIGIVGDGAFRMTCMEISTAVQEGLGCIWFVFNDGELSQISHLQRATYGRTFCTDLPRIDLYRLSQSLGVHYLKISNNSECITMINSALKQAENNLPVIVDVKIDNSRESQFTKGIMATQLKRLPLMEKARMVSRHLIERLPTFS